MARTFLIFRIGNRKKVMNIFYTMLAFEMYQIFPMRG